MNVIQQGRIRRTTQHTTAAYTHTVQQDLSTARYTGSRAKTRWPLEAPAA